MKSEDRATRILVGSLCCLALVLASACGTTDSDDPQADDLIEPPGESGDSDSDGDAGDQTDDSDSDGPAPPPDSLPVDPTEPPVDPTVVPPDPSTPGTDLPPACGGSGQVCCDGGTCNSGLECEADVCTLPTREITCEATPECFLPPESTRNATVTVEAGAPTALAGGTITPSAWELSDIRLYTENTFSSLISFEITDNGDSSGALEFRDGEWAFEAQLDLFISASIPFVGDFDQPVDFPFDGGGCFESEDNRIFTDVSECVNLDDVPDGLEIPNSFTYETGDDYVELLLLVPRETILEAVPDGQAGQFAGIAITGDLPIVLRFEQATE